MLVKDGDDDDDDDDDVVLPATMADRGVLRHFTKPSVVLAECCVARSFACAFCVFEFKMIREEQKSPTSLGNDPCACPINIIKKLLSM
jgi:hypothetical protein